MLSRLIDVLKHRERNLRRDIAHSKSRIEAQGRALEQALVDKSALFQRWRDASVVSGPMEREALSKHRRNLERCHEQMLELEGRLASHRDAIERLEARLETQSLSLRNNLIRAEKLKYLLENGHEFIGSAN